MSWWNKFEVALTYWSVGSDGRRVWSRWEGQRQQVCLRREDVVLYVKRQILGIGKQQEEILEHLSEEEGVHSAMVGGTKM